MRRSHETPLQGDEIAMSKFFINRPIVAMVIAIITVIVGLVTLLGLPVAQFPKIIPPEIFIQANYVGADEQTIEQSVATPLICCSMGVATDCSIVCASAPTKVVCIWTSGGAMLGNCETGSVARVIAPTITVRMEITIATMGRLIKNFVMAGYPPAVFFLMIRRPP